MPFVHYSVGVTKEREGLRHVVMRYAPGLSGELYMFCTHERLHGEDISEYDWWVTCLKCLGAR